MVPRKKWTPIDIALRAITHPEVIKKRRIAKKALAAAAAPDADDESGDTS